MKKKFDLAQFEQIEDASLQAVDGGWKWFDRDDLDGITKTVTDIINAVFDALSRYKNR